jgi:hypothetical protein
MNGLVTLPDDDDDDDDEESERKPLIEKSKLGHVLL